MTWNRNNQSKEKERKRKRKRKRKKLGKWGRECRIRKWRNEECRPVRRW